MVEKTRFSRPGRAGKIAFQRKQERIRIDNSCWYKMIVWQLKAKNSFGIGTPPSTKEIDGSQCGRTAALVLTSAQRPDLSPWGGAVIKGLSSLSGCKNPTLGIHPRALVLPSPKEVWSHFPSIMQFEIFQD